MELTITQWKVKQVHGTQVRYYKNIRVQSPEQAANQARKAGMVGKLVVSGLTVHGETKPMLFVPEGKDKVPESITVHVTWTRVKQYKIRKGSPSRMVRELERRVRSTMQSGFSMPKIMLIEDATAQLEEQIIKQQDMCDY